MLESRTGVSVGVEFGVGGKLGLGFGKGGVRVKWGRGNWENWEN